MYMVTPVLRKDRAARAACRRAPRATFGYFSNTGGARPDTGFLK
jgi:hypothetical protein